MGKKQSNTDIDNLYQSAISLHHEGELSRAIKFYRQLIDQVPDVAELHYNLGLAYFDLEDYGSAIAAYERASALNPQDGDTYFNLGLAYKMDGQYARAEETYLKALELSDDVGDILYNLGCCYQDSGKTEQACIVFTKLLEIIPGHLSALNNLAYLEHLRGNFDTAKELYARILELDPDRQSAQHMYASLSGTGEEAPPQEYVRELFDNYSENFEENLVKDLEYNTFCILRQAVDSLTEKKTRYANGLDLGCGTGLAGEAFQSKCTRLTGVDLSKKMIQQASAKKIYHELYCTDIIEFLEQTDHIYDLIIAADVLPYLGDLGPLLSAASRCASATAFFCLSSEETEKPEWELQQTGRYAHNPDYIITEAQKHGWIRLERFAANIRKENNNWITGSILVFGRNNSPISIAM